MRKGSTEGSAEGARQVRSGTRAAAAVGGTVVERGQVDIACPHLQVEQAVRDLVELARSQGYSRADLIEIVEELA
ncbi:MAG: hypothetical protein ACJ74O_11790 [Frankiaceae bacterium]